MTNTFSDPTSDAPPKIRRFRLRFSLRSLLFSAALAHREGWSPWRVELELRNHKYPASSAAFLPGGRRVVTGSEAYVRLIGDRWTMEQMTTTWKEQIVPRSSDLQQWAGAILEIAKSLKLGIYAYIYNHYAGHGPESARQLIRKLGLV